MKTGFIGLGIMGKPMSKNLLKAGYKLVVYDINADAVRELAAAGAETASSPKEVARQCDVVVTMLPNSPHVKTVALGPGGIIEGARAGMILVDMSSIAPLAAQEVAKSLAEKGVEMLDAPVSGGEPKAIEGTLSIMVGGKRTSSIAARISGKMGAIRRPGAADRQPATRRSWPTRSSWPSISPPCPRPWCWRQGRRRSRTRLSGDPRRAWPAAPFWTRRRRWCLNGNFKPGFRIALHIKDLANALETAHEVGVPIPLTSQVMEIMQALKVDGKAGDDHGGIVQFYEKLANFEARKQ